jgi:DNA polymerase-3 subunit gamma/tau
VALAPDGPGSLDVIEIDAASHGGVDDARDLRERAFYAPVSSRYKVYIVDEAHMVSTQGFNALLKLVEEPPEFLVFIFATTEPDKVLPTIRSRTHHYPFRLMPPGALRGLLERICVAESVTVEPAVYPVVVRAGGGSARDSLSVLDQLLAGAGSEGVTYARAVALLGVTDAALLDEIVDAMAAGDRAAVYQTVDRVVEAGHDPRRFAVDLLERLRDLIILDAVPDAVAKGLLGGPVDRFDRMTDQAARLGTATLSRLADIVHTGLVEMRGTTSPRLLLELLCARMLLPAASGEDGAVLQRLERLERRLTLTGPAPAAPAAPVAESGPPGPRSAPVDEPPKRPARRADPTTASGPATPARPAPSHPAAQPAQPAEASADPRSAARPDSQPDARSGARPDGQPDARSAARPDAHPDAHPDTRPDAHPDARPGARPDSGSGARPVVGSAPVQPAAPTLPAPTGALDATAVRRIWPDVLEAVKRRRRTTHALLMNVSVQSVEGGMLTLAISSEPLSRLLGEEINLDNVRGAVRDVLGVDWRVRVVLDGGPGGTGSGGGASGGAGPGGGSGGGPAGGGSGSGGPGGGGGRAAVADLPPEDPRDADPRDDDPGYRAGTAGSQPVVQTDPEAAAISLLESTLGARRVEREN